MSATAEKIRCGVAGWSYPDWRGYVYPPGTKDELRFVAGFVDMIEINSSFYRPPTATAAEAWVRRTGDLPGFFFTAKIHQDVTHRGLIERPLVEQFHRGFEPLISAGQLRHLLAQFRYDFADTPEGRAHLCRVRESFGDMANIACELRHNTWQSPAALEYLRELGVSVVNLDYPTARNSFNLRVCTVGQDAYFRLHGRNGKAWFSSGAGRDETYNYKYEDRELDEIVRRAVEIASMTRSLTLVANNHYQGKEAVNILQLKARITGRKLPVPDLLAEKYPELASIRQPT